MATRRKATRQPALFGGRKRKKTLDLGGGRDDDDDDILSGSSSEDDEHDETPSVEDEEEDEENLEVKKVRLAREYLDAIAPRAEDGESTSGESSDDDDDADPIARRLQRERLQRAGAWKRNLAGALERAVSERQATIARKHPGLVVSNLEAAAQLYVQEGQVRLLRGHDLSVTSVGLSSHTNQAVSGSKDHSVLLWDVETETKLCHLCPQWSKTKKNASSRSDTSTANNNNNVNQRTAGQVWSVACSEDGRLAAVGKRDATVTIFDLRSREPVQTFRGHKGPVTSLAFGGNHELFSASADRCIRHYDLKDRMYLETLYGHQSGVTAIDCYSTGGKNSSNAAPVSVGTDRTARWWKLAQDSHCIYRGGARLPAADAVAALQEDWFVTGHTDGTVALWKTDKKRAVATAQPTTTTTTSAAESTTAAAGVVSISCVRGSDVVATGSSDGYVRFWKVQYGGGSTKSGEEQQQRGIEALCHIPVHGFVNGLALHQDATYCVAAVGQEHRCGRWERVPRAKNRLAILRLREKGQSQQQPAATLDEAEESAADGADSDEDKSSGGSSAAADFDALD